MPFSETTNYHDPYVDGVTQYKPTHMNLPIAQLDYQIGVNVAAIALLQEYFSIVFYDDDFVGYENNFVIHL